MENNDMFDYDYDYDYEFNFTIPDNKEYEEDINPNIVLTLQILEVIWYIITFLLGIIGNGLVIWIAGFKIKKTVSSLWFLNLAIADFVLVMTLPLQITEAIMGGHWPFGKIMCKVIFTVVSLNMYVRAFFLMIISVDRCVSIMCPVWSNNHRSPWMALTFSAITWTICFRLSAPYLASQTIMIIEFFSTFLIPFVIIVTCYNLIVFWLIKSRSLSRSNRPLKVIAAIVLCFFCFSFPYHAWSFLTFLDVETNATTAFIPENLAYWIIIFNSCVNPIVYVFVGRDFKKILFKSIPLLLENTLKEKEDPDTGDQSHQTMVKTEVESFNL